jgi:hypothetical protein
MAEHLGERLSDGEVATRRRAGGNLKGDPLRCVEGLGNTVRGERQQQAQGRSDPREIFAGA